jgi:hypothetical protein
MSLLLLITAIYASMAVGLFGEQDPINFGRLSRAVFTMFQACTGDGWSVIVRNLFGEDGESSRAAVAESRRVPHACASGGARRSRRLGM